MSLDTLSTLSARKMYTCRVGVLSLPLNARKKVIQKAMIDITSIRLHPLKLNASQEYSAYQLLTAMNASSMVDRASPWIVVFQWPFRMETP